MGLALFADPCLLQGNVLHCTLLGTSLSLYHLAFLVLLKHREDSCLQTSLSGSSSLLCYLSRTRRLLFLVLGWLVVIVEHFSPSDS